MRIHVVRIGKSVPDIIQSVFLHNIDFCNKNNVEYSVHKYDRDQENYYCCGVQAEVEKLSLMIDHPGDVVADWDVVFYDVPKFLNADKAYFGYKNHSTYGIKHPDTFISYHNSVAVSDILDGYKSKLSLYVRQPGFTFVFANDLYKRGLSEPFPDDAFLHLGTGLSMSNVSNTFDEIDKARWLKVETAKYQYWQNFDKDRCVKF